MIILRSKNYLKEDVIPPTGHHQKHDDDAHAATRSIPVRLRQPGGGFSPRNTATAAKGQSGSRAWALCVATAFSSGGNRSLPPSPAGQHAACHKALFHPFPPAPFPRGGVPQVPQFEEVLDRKVCFVLKVFLMKFWYFFFWEKNRQADDERRRHVFPDWK